MEARSEECLKGIALIFVQENLLDDKEIIHYQQVAEKNKSSLQHYLVTHHILSAKKIALAVANNFGLPLFDLDDVSLNTIPHKLINDSLIRHHHMVPLFSRDNQLYVATDDPSQQGALKAIQFHTGLHIAPLIVETDKLNELINKLLHETETQGLTNYFAENKKSTPTEFYRVAEQSAEISLTGEEDTPVIKFVNRILNEAIKKNASDIHFEPYEQQYRIRYRIDGLLHQVATPPLLLSTRIAARIKILANLDISERRIPQDGRFKLTFSSNLAVDFRVSTCPTVGGEKIVMRIMDSAATRFAANTLGFNPLQTTQFLQAIKSPQGMIIVTGPTGSGKTTTLYSALNILNTLEKNISTAEDPVEIKLSGINQVNINPKAGLTFSNTLRAFLRQDPDIIMVGEIRDLETAEIAIKAAQTGHLVLSTLHTNSAAETLTRLVNMGLPSFNIASSVTMIVAQRLVRKLCEHCKKPCKKLTSENLIVHGFTAQEIKNATLFEASGCKRCSDGFKGRVGLFEVLQITKNIEKIILSGGNSADIFAQAQADGMLTIYQSGLAKVQEGLTTLTEINRITIA